jgi:hypothetical protein
MKSSVGAGDGIRYREWIRHSDLNRGPAVYELPWPKRCVVSVGISSAGCSVSRSSFGLYSASVHPRMRLTEGWYPWSATMEARLRWKNSDPPYGGAPARAASEWRLRGHPCASSLTSSCRRSFGRSCLARRGSYGGAARRGRFGRGGFEGPLQFGLGDRCRTSGCERRATPCATFVATPGCRRGLQRERA